MPRASTGKSRGAGPLTVEARALSERLLADDQVRLEHSSGVARAARYAAARLPDVPSDLVVAAAWLHDVGHAAPLVETGFHPVDGAAYLERHGWDPTIVSLVAHHSHSSVAAQAAGATRELARFRATEGLMADVLTFADVIAGQDGRGAPITPLGYGLTGGPTDADPTQADLFRQRQELLVDSIMSVYAALIPDAQSMRPRM